MNEKLLVKDCNGKPEERIITHISNFRKIKKRIPDIINFIKYRKFRLANDGRRWTENLKAEKLLKNWN
jgi:hypothetical protein